MNNLKTPCGKESCTDPSCEMCQEVIRENEAQLEEDLHQWKIERMNSVRDALSQRQYRN